MAIHTPGEPVGPTCRAVPTTSSVRAGWVCVAIGLATAWVLPFMQGFFGVGLIMAIVAMATHQVRAGLLLLAGSVAGAVLCTLIFLSGVLTILGSPFSSAHHHDSPSPAVFAPKPLRLATPAASANVQASTQAFLGRPGGQENRAIATNPLRLADIRLMLRTGLVDAEIIAAIADRQLVEAVGPVEAASLRSLGAGAALLGYLQSRQLSIDPRPAVPVRMPGVVRSNAPLPAVETATPVDYIARDRRIESLKQQMDALDEQIRTIRNNPRDNRYWWHYFGNGNGSVNQAALQKYLDQLDQQRNALRREKWQLEGR